MLNIEKYKDEFIQSLGNDKDFLCWLNINVIEGECLHCKECKTKTLEWLLEEYKEPILTEKEKAYLKNVIEPFWDYVAYVSKFATSNSKLDFLSIYISVNEEKVRSFEIPLMYDLESMFNNIKHDKEYTLEELGL